MITTLTDAKDFFLNDCRHRRKLSEHTLKAYGLDLRALEKFVAASCPDDDLDRLDRTCLNAYLNSLSHCKAHGAAQAGGHPCQRRPLLPTHFQLRSLARP